MKARTSFGQRTLPGEYYTSPGIFATERERIFGRFWLLVGHVSELAHAGSYFLAEVDRESIVVLRDADGKVGAFHNVCRHRGSRLCTAPRGELGHALQCPYHAWTYGLDGRLVAAPRFAREEGGDTSELGLLPVQVDTWGPLVFVNPDSEAPPLLEQLEDVPERIAAAGIDLDALRFHRRVEWEVEANWKISAENFLECYHCPVAHPGFSAAMDVSPDAYLLEASGSRMTQHGPPRPEPKGGYDLTGEVERGQFHLLFPGTVVNVMPGRPNFSIGPVLPLSTERTQRFLDYFVAEDADPAWIEESIEFDRQVGAEDSLLVARVQAGVRSGLLHDGRLLPESELLVAHFQSLVVQALA